MRAGEQDRGLQTASKRRITAMWKMSWMASGIVAAIVLLYLDIQYSAEGMFPIFGTDEISLWLCWALSFIMSPIEMAGTALMTDKIQRRELGGDVRTIAIGICVIVFIADIVTNWLGLYNRAIGTDSINTFSYMVIGVVGLALAFMEYVIESLVSLLSKEYANYKDASQWIKKWNAEHDDDASPRRSPRSSPMGGRPAPTGARGGRPAPMGARGGDGPMRREPRGDGGQPSRRAM